MATFLPFLFTRKPDRKSVYNVKIVTASRLESACIWIVDGDAFSNVIVKIETV
jgi:hypothetical protein